MMRQFNDKFGRPHSIDTISREIFGLKESIGELNMKYVDHNQVKRLLELEIIELKTEEEHLNKKFENLTELYAEPEPKPSPAKSTNSINYFINEKYSTSNQMKSADKKNETMPDTLEVEANIFGVKPEKLPKPMYVKMPDKSWKTTTMQDTIFNRKVDLEDMQNVYDEIMKLKTDLDEAAYTNANLSTQLEAHFKGPYGIKSCSACKKRYTPLNADPVISGYSASVPVPSGQAHLLLLQRLRGR